MQENRLRQLIERANAGEKQAQLELGRMYANGQGVIEDFIEAYKWFLVAGMNGVDVSVEKESLRRLMTPAQIAEAQKRAQSFARLGVEANDNKNYLSTTINTVWRPPLQGTECRSIINSIDMKLIYIPEGEFLMGSPDVEGGRKQDEGPQHKVKISKGFYIGAYPVTQLQYQMILKRDMGVFLNRLKKGVKQEQSKQDIAHFQKYGIPCVFGKHPPRKGDWVTKFTKGIQSAFDGANPSIFKGDNLPVESVDWSEANSFCAKLSIKEGRKYRLPTESEWEYACRAGAKTRFYFGDDNNLLDQYAWFANNSGGTTHPVGLKKPNAYGLYDMLGNVYEWCFDYYSVYVDKPERCLNPYGHIDSLDTNIKHERKGNGANFAQLPKDCFEYGHVLRGGSYESPSELCRCASRHSFMDNQVPPTFLAACTPGLAERYTSKFGFRVVLDDSDM